MSKATLTKRIEFSSSHRYHNDAWDKATNKQIFGPCNNEPSHGHNYLLELTVRGDVDQKTGMIINLYDLKQIVLQVIEEFDHKHLNLDTPYFQTQIPTTENLARVLWSKFSEQPDTQNLETLRLFEGDDLWAEISADGISSSTTTLHDQKELEARITRIYPISIQYAVNDQKQLGKSFSLSITLKGPISPVTGRVTDITALDLLVQEHILTPFHQQLVTNAKEFRAHPFSSELLAQTIWGKLVETIQEGKLDKVTLQEPYGDLVEYSGPSQP